MDAPTTDPRALAAPPVADLAAATAQVTGVEVASALWVVDQLSRVVAFRLADGTEVVAKSRPAEVRLQACARAQAGAAAAGFPCPRPLGATMVDGWAVAVEEHRPGGRPLPVEALGVQVFVDLALTLDDAVGGLSLPGEPGADDGRTQPVPPPWGDPLHTGDTVWPERDARLPDLRTDAAVGWLLDAASRVRRRVARADGPVRVGHLDLETHNMRWSSGPGEVRGVDALVCLDDWDSLGALPEPILVGQAAGSFTSTRDRFTDPTVAQSREFLERWLATSGRSWGREEWELAWAGGLWTKVFNVQDRVVHRDLDGVLGHARPDVEERLRLAGA